MFKINNLVNSHALLLMNWGNDYYVPMLYSSPRKNCLHAETEHGSVIF